MEDIEKKVETLKQWIKESKNIVFFGGAGVSTESGIPDFRSVDGLYNQKFEYPPEKILSRSFYCYKQEYFYRFYREKMLPLGYEPNVTHKVLARLEEEGKLSAVVTQNIDGLHQKAGSKIVHELHGSIHRNYCLQCKKEYPAEFIRDSVGIPLCEECGGIIKPDITLYEEPLKGEVIEAACKAISQADMLIVAGSSLTVYPAANFIDLYRGRRLVLINRDPTNSDAWANLLIHANLGDVFSKL